MFVFAWTFFMRIEKEKMSVFAFIQMQGKKDNYLWEKNKLSPSMEQRKAKKVRVHIKSQDYPHSFIHIK